MIEEKLDKASAAEPTKRQEIVSRLAAAPDATLHTIVSGYHRASRWPVILEVIRAIGQPLNVSAIPWLIEHVDRNSPAWPDLILTVAEFPSDFVVPHLIRTLWPPREMSDEWGYDAESICALLTELDPDFAPLCGPTIAHLLALHIKPAVLDPNYLLDVLEWIGPSCSEYALPSLLGWLSGDEDAELIQRVQGFIAILPSQSVEPYNELLSTIRQPPREDS